MKLHWDQNIRMQSNIKTFCSFSLDVAFRIQLCGFQSPHFTLHSTSQALEIIVIVDLENIKHLQMILKF